MNSVLIKSSWMTLEELKDEYPDLCDRLDYRNLLVDDRGNEDRTLYRITVEREKEKEIKGAPHLMLL